MWFITHIVMSLHLRVGEQDRFPVWENLILMEASSGDEARAKAEERGRLDEANDDESLTWEGMPAKWKFGGVRKVIACDEEDTPPRDGTEVSYSTFVLDSIEDVKRLAHGEIVRLTYEE